MDFFEVTYNYKNNLIEVIPNFVLCGVQDLIVKKGKFVAFFDDKTGYWSIDQNLLIKRLDEKLTHEYNKILKNDQGYSLKNNRVTDKFRYAKSKYYRDLQEYFKLINDCNAEVDVDSTIKFLDSKVVKEDYSTGPLDYNMEKGSTEYWDHLMGVLYDPSEQEKIEWMIGSIITGDSKSIQKFFVFYGKQGTGKSTVFNIIQAMFPKYWGSFDAARIVGTSEFALDTLRSNPLIAIQHDGDLSRVIDNSKLNSIVSHETLSMNTKGKDPYPFTPKSMLIMGTNSPVRITDEQSGIKRRLIVVEPTGNKLKPKEYDAVLEHILTYEKGAIAYKCYRVYKKLGKKCYDNYDSKKMNRLTNALYNFLYENYFDLVNEEYVTLTMLRKKYNDYLKDNNIKNPIEGPKFREELKNFFREYHRDLKLENGSHLRDVYIGFLIDAFNEDKSAKARYIESEDDSDKLVNWLKFDLDINKGDISKLDIMLDQCPAQLAYVMPNGKDRPKLKWENNVDKLCNIQTDKLHYVKPPSNLIVIDFDIKNEQGEKDYQLNLEAANKWPATYAELSKSGAGIHLHYIYSGDITLLERNVTKDIEVKVFTGDATLRRKLSLFNDYDIMPISDGLPLKDLTKGDNVYDEAIAITEKGIRKQVAMCLLKKHHGHTTPEMHFIKKILDEAYESGISYNISDMYNDVLNFALGSSNQSDTCLNILNELHFKSKDNEELEKDDTPVEMSDEKKILTAGDDKPIAVFDIEVFPNLFIFGYKILEGEKHILVNPKYYEIEEIIKNFRLVGFNCLHYDNIITYAATQGYTIEQLYKLSQKIINLPKGEHFNDFNSENVKNICYTDIYDYAKKKQSLKKWEIELSDTVHMELGLAWDQPVPEELWPKVEEYNGYDLEATEKVWFATQTDFKTRQILADISGGQVNNTDNQLTAKLIFGDERRPQQYFYYRNLADPVLHLDPDQKAFLEEVFPEMMAERHGEAQSYLPYFPGYKYDPYAKKDEHSLYKGEFVGEGGLVRAIPGAYGYSKTFDVASEHPHSLASEYLFGKFTESYYRLVRARVYIKHKDFDKLGQLFDGKLMKYMNDKSEAKALSKALKTPINAVYGLTSAKFPNKCKDERNIDNIVAKRGALFMMDLREAVVNKGFTVFHVKTDSLKVHQPTPEIEEFIMNFGKRYGYTFEVEHTFEKICLVNDAVYIAKVTTDDAEWLEACKDAAEKGKPEPTRWTATGAQFAEPYVFKTLFSKEEVTFSDLCQIKNVSKGAIYLDFKDGLPDVTMYEKLRDLRLVGKDTSKLTKKDINLLEQYAGMTDDELKDIIATGHHYVFIGKVGNFCPVKPGTCGAELVCLNENGKYSAVTGTKDYYWIDADYIVKNNAYDCIDMSYYEKLVKKAVDAIEGYSDDFLE